MDFKKRYSGIVRWYDSNKASGFIYCPELECERKTSFYHKALLRNSLVPPTEGDTVNFDIREGDKGLFAQDVVMGEIGEEDE